MTSPPPPPGLSPSLAAVMAGRIWDQFNGLTGDQAGLVVAELMARLATHGAAPPDALDRLVDIARHRLALRMAG